MTRNVFITFDTFEVGLVVLNFFFFFSWFILLFQGVNIDVYLMQTTGRSSGGRERQTKEMNEKEKESTGRCVICILPAKALIPIQSTFMRPAVRTSYYCWPESKILSEGGREAVLNRKGDLGLRLLRCQPPTVFCLTEFIQS